MRSFHLRRKEKEITDPTILKKILRSATYVTLAMCDDNQPYLVSLSHGYDEKNNCIYFHCASEGKKIEYLLQSNRVWGQALLDYGVKPTENSCTHLYASVHFSGKTIFLEDVKEKRHAMECMLEQLNRNSEELIVKLNNEQLKKMRIGKITIEYMTGKKPQEVSI